MSETLFLHLLSSSSEMSVLTEVLSLSVCQLSVKFVFSLMSPSQISFTSVLYRLSLVHRSLARPKVMMHQRFLQVGQRFLCCDREAKMLVSTFDPETRRHRPRKQLTSVLFYQFSTAQLFGFFLRIYDQSCSLELSKRTRCTKHTNYHVIVGMYSPY